LSAFNATPSATPNATPSATPPFAPQRAWTKMRAKFSGSLEGELELGRIVANQNVQIAVCDFDDPNAELRADATRQPEGACVVSCSKVVLATTPSDEKGGAPSFEAEALGNALFRRDDYFGVCESLRYSSAKNQVVLSGSETNKGSFSRQAGSGAPRESLGEFTRCQIRLNPFSYNLEGASYGQ